MPPPTENIQIRDLPDMSTSTWSGMRDEVWKVSMLDVMRNFDNRLKGIEDILKMDNEDSQMSRGKYTALTALAAGVAVGCAYLLKLVTG